MADPGNQYRISLSNKSIFSLAVTLLSIAASILLVYQCLILGPIFLFFLLFIILIATILYFCSCSASVFFECSLRYAENTVRNGTT
jgi:hypothetical protein